MKLTAILTSIPADDSLEPLTFLLWWGSTRCCHVFSTGVNLGLPFFALLGWNHCFLDFMAFLFCLSFNWLTSSSNFLRKDTWGCRGSRLPFYVWKCLSCFCHALWLNSLTRDWTWAPSVKALSPNYWTTREFPENIFNLLSNIIAFKLKKKKKILWSTRKELVWSSGEYLGWFRISVSQLYLWFYAWLPPPVKRGGWIRSQVARFDLAHKDILCRPA